jgi:hypothetical protein
MRSFRFKKPLLFTRTLWYPIGDCSLFNNKDTNMKKALLIAFAAFCAFTAQAVSMSWNSSEGAFAGFKDANGNAVSWSGDFSITVNFTATATPATVFQLLTENGANKAGELRFNSTNWSGNKADFGTYNGNNSAVWLKSNGDFSTARVISSDGSKSNTMKLIFEYNETTNAYTALKYEITFANGDKQSWTMGAPNFGMAEISWTSLVTGANVTMNSMTLESDNIKTSVPEPTALALLALGVAGLALKRKVA